MVFETLESRELLAANPIITEFMASNSNTLEDGDGATPDWIEIYNKGDQGLDLAGYRLTDNATDTNKWVFPSTVLGAGDFLTVFASGNNTPDSAGNLHTNFSLSAGGEYLALVNPSGSILSDYGPNGTDYPAQTSDVSYGLAMNTTLTNAATPNSSSQYLIPTNGSVDATWTQHSFDDMSWQTGTASIGYENSPADYAGLIQTTVPTGTTSVYVRISFNVPDAATLLDKLQMKYDDGFIAYINGTRVASDKAPAVGAYNSVATGDHPDGLAVDYVDFDLSQYSYTLNVGANTLAIHMLNTSSSSDMLSVPNLVLTSGGVIEPQVIGSLASPTPNLPNTNLRASDVQFSRTGGVFVGSFQLSMTAGANESIRYTTDGTNPDLNSPLYAGPFTVNSTQQIRARAYGPVGQVGNIKTETYVKASSSVGSVTSDLPIIVLENLNGGIPDENFQDSTFSLYDVDLVTGLSSLSNPADVTSLSAQHRRGKSTFGQPKLNLRIELRDNFGEDRSESLLGMPSESDWILYAPWTIDRTMVRHALIYDLSRQTGTWAPRTRYVDVYSNYDGGDLTDNDYVGTYVLMEVIKRDDNRVDIAELTPTQNSAPDITGGYILQIDEAEPNDASWDSSRGYPKGNSQFVHVEPERIDMTQAQVDYIRDYVEDFEDALFGPNFTDPVLGYQAYLDVDAAIDFHLFNVFSGNPDAFRLSTYLTKDRGGKLAFGPLWDFDRAMGPDEDNRTADPTKWMSDEAYLWVTQYWNRLFQDANFEQRWVDRWQELRQTVFSNANLEATLQSHTDQLTQAQARNAARWGSGIAPNGGPLADPGLTGWEGEISHLENWLVQRANWIDTQMISAPTFGPEPGNVAVNTQVTLSAQPGANIYYTLDGSDPRASGGGIKVGAFHYTGPITVTQSTEITARAKKSGDFFNGWSGAVTGLFSLEVPADASNLRITELQYHPANPTSAELAIVPDAEDNDFEFIELLNISNDVISLNGVKFIGGISFEFSSGNVTSLAPGESIVAVENEAAFIARYGNGILTAGKYTNDLSNGGDHVVLTDGNDQIIHDFTYSDDDPWPTIADGGGPSLEVIDTAGNYNSSSNWRASAGNGTPGMQTVSQPADFDNDSDVDGADFLAWQRGFGISYDANHLNAWQSHYGESVETLVSAQLRFTENIVPISPAQMSSEPLVGPSGFFLLSLASPFRSGADEAELEHVAAVDLAFEQLQRIATFNSSRDSGMDEKYLSADSSRSDGIETIDDRRDDDEFWGAVFDEVFTVQFDS
ncbi:CotH kinase family protein [Bythopirellula polymerisocia]|uniref:CotH kinase family protein n=1 Tax=Bythopirellula polymerisocia TaxID=2528003 RepID=UPI0018D30800|nr:CotH kinase family protein [Bythopirellula polymerisocia]